MALKELTLPAYGWKPRQYQLPLWNYLQKGGKRAVVAWHRRAGKDEMALQFLAQHAFLHPGSYFYMFPQTSHARNALWNAINPHTKRRRIFEIFPEEICAKVRESDMVIELISPTGTGTGAIIQFLGSDNYDRIVGASAKGVVFSEYALADPRSWDLISPMLVESDGFAIFISTPRGKNHFYDLHTMAQGNPGWFSQVLSAEDTTVFTREQLDGEKANLINGRGEDIGLAIYNQEYLCSFSAASIGACYASTLERWASTNQTKVPWNPMYPVYTGWDIGFGDATAIWFAQVINKEIHLIDHYENSGNGIDHYAKYLKDKPYTYEVAILPHDAAHGNVRTEGGKSFEELMKNFGFKTHVIGRRNDISAVLQQVRLELPNCYFDTTKCKFGLDALKHYAFKWDPTRKILSELPVHDWSSHSSDAFSHLIIGLGILIKPTVIQKKRDRHRNTRYEYGTSVWSM